MLPAKITKTILILGKMRLRFHVKLESDMHAEWEFNDSLYATINPSAFATIENTDKTGVESSVMLTQSNIFSAITAVNKIIKNIYEKNIYATRNGKLVIYDDEANKHRTMTQLYGGGALLFRPAIVYDNNETSYEGATMFINNTDNAVNLSIDQLEAFRYALTKIDFYVYAQLLTNYAISYYKYDADTNTKRTNTNQKRNQIVWADNSATENIQSTFVRKKTDEMEELMK